MFLLDRHGGKEWAGMRFNLLNLMKMYPEFIEFLLFQPPLNIVVILIASGFRREEQGLYDIALLFPINR